MSSLAATRQHTHSTGVYAVAGVILALAVAGAAMAASILTGGPVFLVDGHRPGIGDAVETSFGAVTVQHVDRIAGVSNRAMGGMPMGSMPEMVHSDQMQVSVSATVSNLSSKPVAYDARQFKLVLEGGKKVPATGANIRPGTLQPDSAIDIRVGFIVPRQDSRISLEFEDGAGEPVAIDLGRIAAGRDRAPSGGGHEH